MFFSLPCLSSFSVSVSIKSATVCERRSDFYEVTTAEGSQRRAIMVIEVKTWVTRQACAFIRDAHGLPTRLVRSTRTSRSQTPAVEKARYVVLWTRLFPKSHSTLSQKHHSDGLWYSTRRATAPRPQKAVNVPCLLLSSSCITPIDSLRLLAWDTGTHLAERRCSFGVVPEYQTFRMGMAASIDVHA